MLRQRIRGLIGTTITACIPWTALGFLTGMVFRLDLVPNLHVHSSGPLGLGLVGVCSLAGALVGMINGVTFSGLLFAAERGKTIDDLRAWRFAAWGAVATAGTLGLLSTSVIGAALGAGLGATAAVVTLATARRARIETTMPRALTP
jgi:hypothetical protein